MSERDELNELVDVLRRHGRCHCGSRRPYRACCWEADARRLARERRVRDELRRVGEAARQRGVDLQALLAVEGAYERFAAEVGVELVEDDACGADDCEKYADPDVFLRDATPYRRAIARDSSLYHALRALPTERLLDELRAAGVALDAARCRGLSRHTSSAWAAGARWRAERDRARPLRGLAAERWFFELAGVEVWRRFVRGALCQEQVEDRLGDGWVRASLRRDEEALCQWIEAWNTLMVWLHPEADTLEAATHAFAGARRALPQTADSLSEMLFRLAAQGTKARRGTVRMATELMLRLAGHFRGEPAAWRAELRADAAEALFRTGRREDAEEVFEALRRELPNDGAGYVRHALVLAESRRRRRADRADDRAQALLLLKSALERPVDGAEGWDLPGRIAAVAAGRRYEPAWARVKLFPGGSRSGTAARSRPE